MGRTTVTREIRAPLARVFDVIAHIENFRKAIPHIVEVEFLSDTRRGVGARFRETRLMGKRRATVELEVTEYVANQHVRLVSEAGGTCWDTLFRVKQVAPDRVELTLVMDATPRNFFARVINPLIAGMIRKAVEADMDAVKKFCEA